MTLPRRKNTGRYGRVDHRHFLYSEGKPPDEVTQRWSRRWPGEIREKIILEQKAWVKALGRRKLDDLENLKECWVYSE